MRQRKMFRVVFAPVAIVTLAAVAAGCGGDNSNESRSGPQGGSNAVDRAFVRLMIPHHESAVQMARLAGKKSGHSEIKALALNIETTQTAEIDQMNGIARSVGAHAQGGSMSGMHNGGHAMGDPGDLRTLGLTGPQAGMSMSLGTLDRAKPFDRAFIDMMVPHHMGAIRMAKVELAKGRNPELKSLARHIVSAQQEEIGEMNSWRKQWYGAPVAGSG